MCGSKFDSTTGALTQVNCLSLPNGSTTANANTNAFAVDPSGKFIFVTNPALNNVSAFGIDAATRTLSPVRGSPFPAGSEPNALAIDAKGFLLYVTNGGSNDVSAYVVDRTSGALTAIAGSPFVAGSSLGAISLL